MNNQLSFSDGYAFVSQVYKIMYLGLQNTVNGLWFAAAWAAAARMPMCMLSVERTDEDMLVGCLLARLMPKRSCCF